MFGLDWIGLGGVYGWDGRYVVVLRALYERVEWVLEVLSLRRALSTDA